MHPFLILIMVFSLTLLTQLLSAQQMPTYKLISPDLVAQGEVFTGTVVEVTDKGEIPLEEGDEVFFGTVAAKVEEGGRIQIPAIFKETGNFFITALVSRLIEPGKEKPRPIEPQHVEVVPGGRNVPTKIARSSNIVAPNGLFRVEGQGLNALRKATLEGSKIGLDKPIASSSLQQIYRLPKDIPKGTYRFVGWDEKGKRYESPNTCSYPKVKDITGTKVTHVGQRGEISFVSDTDTCLEFRGGSPQIKLDMQEICAIKDRREKVGFEALRVGDYHVSFHPKNQEDILPPKDAAPVDTRPEPIEARYNPKENKTDVSSPVKVVDQKGQPVSNVPVDIALTQPGGVEYGRITTDKDGRANFYHSFPGHVAISMLSTHVYRVLEREWKRPPDRPTVTTECVIDTDIKPGPGIGVEVVAPNEGNTAAKENEKIPLVVSASDGDQLIQKCFCIIEGERQLMPGAAGSICAKDIGIVDSVDYKWSLLAGKGTLLNASGPSTLYHPPDVAVGKSDDATIEVEITDSRSNDKPAKVIFTLNTKRDEECKYTRNIKVRKDTERGEILTITSGNCDCPIQKEKWQVVPPLNGDTAASLKVCAGERMILKAEGTDSDTLELLCAGECGVAKKKLPLIDEMLYLWTAEKGGFPDHGGRALTNSRGTTAIYKAPQNPGEDTIKVKIQDSGRQASDAPIIKETNVKVFKVDLQIEGVSEDDEECEGGYVSLNRDDDNENGVIDYKEKGPIAGEDDLIKITMIKDPKEGKVTLKATTGADKIKVWETPKREKEVELPKAFQASELPKDLWVEGVKLSERIRDVELLLESDDPPCQDKGKLTVTTVDLDVDTDRDGTVDDEKDEKNEEGWKKDRGAILVLNNDDDEDTQHLPDNWAGGFFNYEIDLATGLPKFDAAGNPVPLDSSQNTVVDADPDKNDLSSLWLRKIPVLPDGWKVFLRLKQRDALRVRIFKERRATEKEILGPDAGMLKGEFKEVEVPAGDITARDLEYGTEAISPLEDGFGGNICVFLVLRDKAGQDIFQDRVRLQVTPLLLLSNNETAEVLYATAIPGLTKKAAPMDPALFLDELGAAVGGANIKEASMGDIWTQDEWELGFTSTKIGMTTTTMPTVLDLPRDRPLDVWGKGYLLGKVPDGVGVALKDRKFHLINMSGSLDSIVYGGNIEVSPPTTDYPMGRIVMGADPSGPADPVRSFLKAQRLQAKKVGNHFELIEPDTGWLMVAHVDEMLSFVPKGAAGPNSAGGDFRIAVADIDQAIDLLKKLDEEVEGVATGGAANTISDSTKKFTAGQWKDGLVLIIGGTGNGQVRMISANTKDTITVLPNWTTNPDKTSKYRLIPPLALNPMLVKDGTVTARGGANGDRGVVTGSAAASLTDASQAWVADKWKDGYVRIVSGKGAGQIREVAGNTPNTVTVAIPWANQPDSTSAYVVIGKDRSLFWNPPADSKAAFVTVYDILNNSDADLQNPFATKLRDKNEKSVKKHLNFSLNSVKTGLGLKDADFIKFPQLYMGDLLDPTDPTRGMKRRTSRAYWPGVANLQVFDNKLLIPKPYGPKDQTGKDIIEEEIKAKLGGLGFIITFINTWNPFHLGDGETHCGTNVRRKPSATMEKWWEYFEDKLSEEEMKCK